MRLKQKDFKKLQVLLLQWVCTPSFGLLVLAEDSSQLLGYKNVPFCEDMSLLYFWTVLGFSPCQVYLAPAIVSLGAWIQIWVVKSKVVIDLVVTALSRIF